MINISEISKQLTNNDYFKNLETLPDFAKNLIALANTNLVWILLGVFCVYLIWSILKAGYKTTKLAIFAVPIIFIMNTISKTLINSPRPFMLDPNIKPFIDVARDNGFPSEKTLIAVSLALILFSESKLLGTILSIGAIFVGLGSYLSGNNNPIDILGAFIVAVVGIIFARFVMKLLNI